MFSDLYFFVKAFFMIRIYLLVVLIYFLPLSTYSQLGINTANPKATLDVVGHPDDPNVIDGLIAPHLTLVQLHTKTYTIAQTGAIVYITNSDLNVTPLPDAYRYISAAGYYIFDGTVWNPLEAQTGDVIFSASLGDTSNTVVQSITGDRWAPIQLNTFIVNIGGGEWNDGSAANEYDKYTYTIPVSGTYLVCAYIKFTDVQGGGDNYINVGEISSPDANAPEGRWQVLNGVRQTADYFRIRYYEKGQKVSLYMYRVVSKQVSNAFLYMILFNTVG